MSTPMPSEPENLAAWFALMPFGGTPRYPCCASKSGVPLPSSVATTNGAHGTTGSDGIDAG